MKKLSKARFSSKIVSLRASFSKTLSPASRLSLLAHLRLLVFSLFTTQPQTPISFFTHGLLSHSERLYLSVTMYHQSACMSAVMFFLTKLHFLFKLLLPPHLPPHLLLPLPLSLYYKTPTSLSMFRTWTKANKSAHWRATKALEMDAPLQHLKSRSTLSPFTGAFDPNTLSRLIPVRWKRRGMTDLTHQKRTPFSFWNKWDSTCS